MMFARAVVFLAGIIYALFGLYGIVYPVDMASMVSFELGNAHSRVEMRSAFGLYLCLGAWFVGSAVTAQLIQHSLAALFLSSGGLLLGRIIGLIIDGFADGQPIPAGIFEFSSCILALVAYRRLVQPNA